MTLAGHADSAAMICAPSRASVRIDSGKVLSKALNEVPAKHASDSPAVDGPYCVPSTPSPQTQIAEL